MLGGRSTLVRGSALAMALVTLRCAGAPPAEPAPPSRPAPPVADPIVDAGPPRCAADPQVAWLDPRDRECAGDADCVFVVGDGCEMFGISVAGAAREAYAPHRCLGHWGGPSLPFPSCMCAVPGIETRCAEGCCQKRFFGTDGPWLP